MIINPYAYAVVGAAWNPSDKHAGISLTNSNKTATNTATTTHICARAVFFASSGKKYYEVSVDLTDAVAPGAYLFGVGKSGASLGNFIGSDVHGYGWQCTISPARRWNNFASVSYGAQCVVNDIVSVVFDLDAGSLSFWKNGSDQGVAFTGLSGTFFPMVDLLGNNGTRTATGRFASADWTYSPPGGYSEW